MILLLTTLSGVLDEFQVLYTKELMEAVSFWLWWARSAALGRR